VLPLGKRREGGRRCRRGRVLELRMFLDPEATRSVMCQIVVVEEEE
jgi:hypothetical protein